MISIPGQYGATCDGFSRREFLRLGGAGLVGVSLSDILRIQAQQAPGVGPAPGAPKNGWGRAKSVIILYLQGGPSHIGIWDPKPDAPSNVRGDFKPIRTKVPGIEIGELFPKLASIADKTVFIRSMIGATGDHYAFQCLTGWHNRNQPPGGWPAIGSVLSKLHGSRDPALPALHILHRLLP